MSDIHYRIGSVISGTTEPRKLIPAFVEALEIDKACPLSEHDAKLLAEIKADMQEPDYYESESCSGDLECLFDMMQHLCGFIVVFFEHPEEPTNYGFWFPENWREEFMGIIVRDLADVPAGNLDDVLLVRESGLSYYLCRKNGELELQWLMDRSQMPKARWSEVEALPR